ncbi:NUDIX hydrolase domain-like protein [Cladorrhinum sp. PSN332]|nr:NUDIX hydrolase domain-like protein [Cladorrhinum sp. PSN332]
MSTVTDETLEQKFTMLQLVKMVDTWPYPSDPNYAAHLSKYYTLHVTPYPSPLGYLHRDFVYHVPWPAGQWEIRHDNRRVTLTPPGASTFESRTEAMRAALLAGHKHSHKKVRSLRRWTDEDFPLFYPPNREIVLKLDGCGVDMLGGINESVFVVAYVTVPGQEHLLWISRRARWKSAYPNMWDCTAGGGLAWGESALDGIVREAWEEVAFPAELTRANARYHGENSFQLCRTELGEDGCQMQIQHLFDVDLTGVEGVVPSPELAPTEEVSEVRLVAVSEVKQKMMEGKMKPGAAMVMLDWMIRWGYVSELTEGKEEFDEIQKRLKRTFDVV